jgi:hypothetical protein
MSIFNKKPQWDKNNLSCPPRPEAVSFLQNMPHVPLADLLASCLTAPSRIPGFRKAFGDKQREQEEELISEHGLSISEREIPGVKVLVIAPRKIKAEYEDC